MKAAILREVRRLQVSAVPEPHLQPDEVELEILATGVCGSDLHAYLGTHPFRKPPLILGHEIVGRVWRVGTDADRTLLGTMVAIEPQVGCGHCPACAQGRYNLCGQKRIAGVGSWQGGMAEKFVAPASTAFVFHDDLRLDVAVLAEPLAVALHALRWCAGEKFRTFGVVGLGPVGYLILAALYARGQRDLIGFDLSPFRARFAERIARQVISGDAQAPEAVSAITAGAGLDACFVAASSSAAIDLGLRTVRAGGLACVVGIFADPAAVDLNSIQRWEQRLVGSCMYVSQDMKDAVELLSKYPEIFKGVVTHQFRLDDAQDAITLLDDREAPAMKAIVVP